MDDIRLTINHMQERMDDFGGALEDLSGEQRAMTEQSQRLTKQSERLEETATKLSRAVDLFKIAISDVFDRLVQHDTDQLRWRNDVEDRLSGIERRLAG